ncbi:MAG: hypothetical protein RLZZ08_1351 [Pseudomonadota bacterium]|jgi:hypothetical protein
MIQFGRAAAAGVLACALLGGTNAVAADAPQPPQQLALKVQQSPIVFLPGRVEAGSGDFKEIQLIVQVPLRWAMSTRLAQEVVVQNDKGALTFAKGALLPEVAVRRGSAREILFFAFCTRSRVAETREGSGLAGVMFGSMLNSLRDGQQCLQDTNGDGKLDRAIALGMGPDVVDLGAVEPVPFTELKGEPINPDADSAQFILARVGRRAISVNFGIQQQGGWRRFTTMQSGRFHANSYFDVGYGEGQTARHEVMGLGFTVDQADPKGNHATVRWEPAATRDEFVVVPDFVQTRTCYLVC